MPIDEGAMNAALDAGTHYPIRCVCCFKEIEPKDLLFRWEDRTETAQSRRRDHAPAVKSRQEDEFEAETDFDFGEEDEEPEQQPFLSVGELVEQYVVTRLDTSTAEGGMALPGGIPSRITVSTGEMEFILASRYCPYCRRRLPNLAGTVPTYFVTLLGPSNAGKTVFLCALYRMLTMEPSRLPCGGTLTGSADLSYNAISEPSNRMYQGYLPDTTVDVFSEPVVLKLDYQNVQTNVKRSCLFAVSDMKGETIHNVQFLDDQTALGDQYKNADGFLFFADPEKMNRVQAEFEDLTKDGGKTVSDMIDVITTALLSLFPGNKVNTPSVIFLTKIDVLLERMGQLMLKFPYTQERQRTASRCVGSYYAHLENETKKLLGALDNNLFSFLEGSFSRTHYTTVAALGITPHRGAEGKVREIIDLRHSIRLAQPVVLLLTMLGFLPPYANFEEMPAKDPQLRPRELKRLEQYRNEIAKRNNETYVLWKRQQNLS